MIRKPALGALSILCATLFTAPMAVAQSSKVEIGTLTCSGSGGVGYIVGSKKTFSCRFKPIGQPSQSYRATITKIGVDVGVTGNTTLVWTVLAPAANVKGRVLAGNYGGAAANAAVGIGGGANLLVGGFRNSITLQPLSVQGQTGLNLAVGVAGMALR
jgi:hypothetical protein